MVIEAGYFSGLSQGIKARGSRILNRHSSRTSRLLAMGIAEGFAWALGFTVPLNSAKNAG
jgi:Fe2+ transport system protein FeoA